MVEQSKWVDITTATSLGVIGGVLGAILGGSFDLDRVIIKNEKQVVDHIKFQTMQKVQATRALFHDLFINGDSGQDERK